MRGFSHFHCSSDRSTGKVRAVSHSSTPVQWYYDGVNLAIFKAVLLDGWDGDTARVTETMPGIVRVDEEVEVSGGVISWDLDAKALNHLASNFDYEQRVGVIGWRRPSQGCIAFSPAQAMPAQGGQELVVAEPPGQVHQDRVEASSSRPAPGVSAR